MANVADNLMEPAAVQPAPVQPGGINQPAQEQQVKAELEKEEKAVKNLEKTLIEQNGASRPFINELHKILDLDKPAQTNEQNEEKLLLLRYAHKLENKIKDANPYDVANLQKDVLLEASLANDNRSILGS